MNNKSVFCHQRKKHFSKNRYSSIKEEILELFGAISVEELIKNRHLQFIFKDITNSLNEISLTDKYMAQGRF